MTEDLSFETIRKGESVIDIRDEGERADFDIFAEGSRRERIRFEGTDIPR